MLIKKSIPTYFSSCCFFVMLLFCMSLFASPVDHFCKLFDKAESSHYSAMAQEGYEALKVPNITAKECANVHARLASLHYYLGDYQKVKAHALSCKKYAQEASCSLLVVRSLYLLSAYHRAQAQQTEGKEERQTHFNQARTFIHKALLLVENIDCPALKAKVLFNAGASYADDLTADPTIAIAYYQKALTLLPTNTIDTYRTSIRLSRAQLKAGLLPQAWETLAPLFEKELKGRVLVHLYYVAAQIAQAQNHLPQASMYAKKGLTIAEKLSLSIDQKRINALLAQILSSSTQESSP